MLEKYDRYSFKARKEEKEKKKQQQQQFTPAEQKMISSLHFFPLTLLLFLFSIVFSSILLFEFEFNQIIDMDERAHTQTVHHV